MALPILATPILSRLYVPADYGLLAAYMALSGLFTVAAVWQLNLAIIAERSERSAVAMLSLCSLVSAIMAILAAVVVLCVWRFTLNDATWQPIHPWLPLLPITVLGSGITMAIAALANRRSRYGFMAKVQVVSISASVALSIYLGFAGWGVDGLFSAYFIQQAVAFAAHFNLLRTLEGVYFEIRKGRLAVLFRKHRNFALFSLPSEFIGTVNQNMPIYVLSAMGVTASLGAFSRARALVALPFTLMGSAIATVFRQRAAEQYNETGNCRSIYMKTGLSLFVLGLLPILFLIAFAPKLFEIVLGPNWVEAGEFARLLAPMLLFRLVASPLSGVFSITGHQKRSFQLMVFSLLLCLAFTLIPALAGYSSHVVVSGFTIAYSLTYIVFMVNGYAITLKPKAL